MTRPAGHTLEYALEVVIVDGEVGLFSQASGFVNNEAFEQSRVDRVER